MYSVQLLAELPLPLLFDRANYGKKLYLFNSCTHYLQSLTVYLLPFHVMLTFKQQWKPNKANYLQPLSVLCLPLLFEGDYHKKWQYIANDSIEYNFMLQKLLSNNSGKVTLPKAVMNTFKIFAVYILKLLKS